MIPKTNIYERARYSSAKKIGLQIFKRSGRINQKKLKRDIYVNKISFDKFSRNWHQNEEQYT
jgi:hypothetical protein